MASIIDLPIVGQSYHLKDWSIDCQRTLNLYPQVVESGNTPQVSALMPTEGLIRRYELVGKIRGIYALTDALLVVSGTQLYLIKNAEKKLIGEVSGEGLVYFADNSIHVMVVSDSAYKYTILSQMLEKIVVSDDTGFMGAGDVAFLDSRFIWVVPNTGRIQWSALLNTTTSGLNYATAESKSDNLVRVVANNGQLWLIGTKTTEIWSSAGVRDLPYQRMSGAYLPVGCVAKESITQFGSDLIWLAQSEHGFAQIIKTQGYQTARISNHAIESEISKYSKIDDAYSFSYQQAGHNFFVISFPSAQKTWVFDAITNMWHERSFYNKETQLHEHHRAMTHCFYNNEHLVGDREKGLIYALTTDAKDDDGALIVRERITPCINPQGQRLIFDEVELICQSTAQDGSNPTIMFDWSDDKGKTWSFDRQETLGGIGQYNKRILFRRLGQSFSRVFRVRMTDSANLVLLGAKAKVR